MKCKNVIRQQSEVPSEIYFIFDRQNVNYFFLDRLNMQQLFNLFLLIGFICVINSAILPAGN